MAGCGAQGPRWPWEKTVPVTPQERPGGKRAVRKVSSRSLASKAGETGKPSAAPGQGRREGSAGVKNAAGDIEGPTPLVTLVGDAGPKESRKPKASLPRPAGGIAAKPKAETAEVIGPALSPPPKPEEVSRPKIRPAPTPAGGRATVVAASMLQVNDRFITIEDVLQNVRPQLVTLPANMPQGAFRRRAADIIDSEVRTLIQQALILGEARNRLTDDQKSQIDAEMESNLQDMIAGVGGSKKKLEESIAAKGATLKTLLEAQRRRLTIRLYLQQKFLPAVAINRQMLWNYYRRHRSEFSRKKRVGMQLIAAPLDAFIRGGVGQATPAEISQARREARKLISLADKRLRGGGDFTKIARELSKGLKARSGGIWPVMAAGNFREEDVEAAAFVLRQGEVSDIIETPTGYYIVKARKVIPAHEATFEAAQVRIQKRLREKQFNRLVGEYFQQLYRGATIVQSKKFIQMAVERAARQRFGK